MAGRWVDMTEAARELGISTDAVRKRIARGALEASRENGRVLVWLDVDGTEAGREALLENLREQVHYLRSILSEERAARQRAETITELALEQLTWANAALAARTIRALEAPAPPESPEPREEPETNPERPERAEPAEPADPQREEPERVPTERVEPERTEPQTAVGGPQTGPERPWWRRMFSG